jgi:flavin reductase (DIM6/NTAB) family NADH-FMN oxidoreductase RutF
MTAIETRALRDAFGSYLTGVTVVTTRDAAGTPVGFTANSFSSVSLDPPLLLVCPARALNCFQVFEACKRFVVNVLAEGQEEISNLFARHRGDRFAWVGWHTDAHGYPLIEGAAAQFSCRKSQVILAGDHAILLGAVDGFIHSGARGLGFTEGRYFSLGLEREAASAPRPGRLAFAGAIIVQDGQVLLEQTPSGLRPPQLALGERVRVRAALGNWLAGAGHRVTLGQAYSVFDQRETGVTFTYFLAQAESRVTGGLGHHVPIEKLADQQFVSNAHAEMLRRFAIEHETQSFGLYVGEEIEGEVHNLTQ